MMLRNKNSTYSLFGTEFVLQSDLVFVEVSNGIYQVIKDRQNLIPGARGSYVGADTVLKYLNSRQKLKVSISKDDINRIIHANFNVIKRWGGEDQQPALV